jgi:hypothetical protein
MVKMLREPPEASFETRSCGALLRMRAEGGTGVARMAAP